MGRQIHFYALPEDHRAFLRWVQEQDPVVATLRDSDSAHVQPLADLNDSGKQTVSLWNRRLLPNLERKWIADPGYFPIDTLHTSTLEFSPSFVTTWEGKPALCQGRVFGDFDTHLGKSPEFDRWYEKLVRWIRKNYRKSPTSFGGYLAPEANKFYQEGGYLLPQFLPPTTKVWLVEIGKQHPRNRA
jgi:hypothetical protein